MSGLGAETSAESPLSRYANARDDLLTRIVRTLEADDRVAAAWLAGSFGRGDADAWSDLDLHIAVVDAHYPAFWGERIAFYDRFGHPILIQPEIPGNTGIPGGSFQLVFYAGPLGPIEVDWCAGPASAAVLPGESRLLFDRFGIPLAPLPAPPALSSDERRAHLDATLTFFWAMASIAVKYAARGETAQAIAQVDLLVQSFSDGWRLIQRAEPDLVDALPRFGRSIDPPEVFRVILALCAEMERLHPEIESSGVCGPTAMSGEVARLVVMADGAVGIE